MPSKKVTKKKTRKQPTRKQKAVVDKIIENRGISTSQAMREVGYSENTAKNPKNLTESEGYQQLLEDAGLTEDLVATALADDIRAKKQNRHQELKLGADILGMTKKGTEGAPSVAVQVNIDNVERKVNSIFEDAE